MVFKKRRGDVKEHLGGTLARCLRCRKNCILLKGRGERGRELGDKRGGGCKRTSLNHFERRSPGHHVSANSREHSLRGLQEKWGGKLDGKDANGLANCSVQRKRSTKGKAELTQNRVGLGVVPRFCGVRY